MNSVGMRRKNEIEPEDFFTSLSFSTLIGELTDKESMPYTSFEPIPHPGKNKVRISNDFERVWNAKEDQHLINRIFS